MESDYDTKELQAVLQDLEEVDGSDNNRFFRNKFGWRINRYNICKLCGKHVYSDAEACDDCMRGGDVQ